MATPPRPAFEAAMATTLQKTCYHYLQHGLTHLLAPNQTEGDLLQAILNVQGAFEAVSKLQELKSAGWTAIVEDKHHDWSDARLLKALDEGKLKTVRYEQSKTSLLTRKGIPKDQQDMIQKLQRLRNSIAHLGLPQLPVTAREEITILTVRVLNEWVWEIRPKAKEGPYLQNQARMVLDGHLFQKLKSDPIYESEAMELAYEKGEKVRRCPECKVEAWAVLREDNDELFCFCCGYQAVSQMISFGNCPVCSEHDFLYDAMNWHGGNPVGGTCLDCWQHLEVRVCGWCNNVSINNRQQSCPGCNVPYQQPQQ
ncbi:MAG: hypothetical protein H0X66_19465 [Verrucomicrobia bacterium]|nr:hypothetical protein [Verrucomicrobiota bacterium]